MYPGFFFFDPMYLVFALPALLLAFYAQWKVKSAYSRYSQVRNMRGVTGVQVARSLLDAEGLNYVSIEGTPGELSDHYDPRGKVLRLSSGVANSASVASLGIVAHEVGHAVQDARAYGPLRFRAALVPAVNLGSWLGPIIFMLGFFMQSVDLASFGLILFSAAAVFALITLPVELDASRRALKMLSAYGMVDNQDLSGARSVLTAAALTYVAAVAQALSTLLDYGFLLSGMRRRD
jgi:Zn-dependent membrane protease YugP